MQISIGHSNFVLRDFIGYTFSSDFSDVLKNKVYFLEI